MVDTSRFIIYALLDPRDGQMRYIGKSSYGMKRCRSHCYPGALKRDKTRKGQWIKRLLSLDLKPDVFILESLNEQSGLNEAEIWNIAYWKSIGVELFNHTTGGEGAPGRKKTEKEIQRLREANLGNKNSAGKKQILTEDQRQKLADKARARSADPEVRKKISAALTGKTQSFDTIAKRAAALKGQKRTEEQKQALAKSLTGVPHIAARKPIVDSNGIVYSGACEAAQILGLNSRLVSSVLCGRRASTGGMTFRWIEAGETDPKPAGPRIVKKRSPSSLSRSIVDSLGRVFPSIAEAARQLGLGRTHINNVLKGWSYSAGGLTFKYVSKNEVLSGNS